MSCSKERLPFRGSLFVCRGLTAEIKIKKVKIQKGGMLISLFEF